MGGGVALNSVANGKLLRETPFEDVFIQPAAGDDGASYGVAASIYYQGLGNDRTLPRHRREQMNGCYLGPQYSAEEVEAAVEDSEEDLAVGRFGTVDALLDRTADLLADQKVVGIYQGRMEWGPRALGNRSILADPRDGEMQDVVNQKIKFREGFRPFAPSVLADHAQEYFDIPRESPYMLFVFDVHEDKREEIPAVTHVDGTSRIQTVQRADNPVYYDLIDTFREKTGTPVVLNTSLNRRGEPIVNTPQDATDCFLGTNMDYMCFPDANLLISEPEDEESSAEPVSVEPTMNGSDVESGATAEPPETPTD
jgi:carbamoyltransferase